MASNILYVPDTQIRPDNLEKNLPLAQAIGELIVSWRPDIVVFGGDHFDMASLSVHDMGKINKKTFDGGAVRADIEAGRVAMDVIQAPLLDLQQRQRSSKHKVYAPTQEFLIGNHEERASRFPELRGLVSYDDMLEGYPFNVHDFLEVVEIEGVLFSHYFYNPLSGRPYGGSAEYRLNKIKRSFVQGHEQTFRTAEEYLSDGSVIKGLIAGACYLHDEPYKGYQGNNHYRGVIMMHGVENGNYDLEQVSVKRLLGE